MLPSYLHSELDKIIREFFCNKGTNHKPLISWDRICKPREFGGLGIRQGSTNETPLKNHCRA